VSQKIEDLLHRRTDLSTFVIHFTRNSEESSALDNLTSILKTNYIEARNPFGMGRNVALRDRRFAEDTMFQESQKVVCFSETPIEHAWMMCTEIEGRENGFEPYALAFTKSWARTRGVNPVWYLDMTPGYGHDWLTKPIDTLRDEAVNDAASKGRSLSEYPIIRILPFLEQMGPMSGVRKEWWWEREWRRVGHLNFAWSEVVAILAPAEQHTLIHEEITRGVQPSYLPPPLLDPNWGLERMTSALRGIPDRFSDPFPK
jgi:hypothetical protein